MTRVVGWQAMLNRYLLEWQERYRSEGFRFGATDCVHFVADWVWYSTLADPLGRYRNAYASKDDASRLIAEEGSLAQALSNRFEQVHPAHAQRGDIAYLKIADTECCGLIFTSGARMMALFLGEGGFTMHRVRDVHLAFKVGR